MDHPLIDLINSRIAAAERDGAFDNLEGAGKPLPDCEDPKNAVMTRIMKESGAVPEAVALTRKLAALRSDLLESSDRSARAALIREIALTETALEIAKRNG